MLPYISGMGPRKADVLINAVLKLVSHPSTLLLDAANDLAGLLHQQARILGSLWPNDLRKRRWFLDD